jgi:hypothetical protein
MFKRKIVSSKGQATVESAFLLPVVFLLFLILCQPVILLYNRMVMSNAAAEGCRLLATQTSTASGAYAADAYKRYIERRLASIPPVSLFHIHEEECSYQIELSGDENSAVTKVSISNKLRLLPLIGLGAQLLGVCEAGGIYEQRVEVQVDARPDWLVDTPEDWLERWE